MEKMKPISRDDVRRLLEEYFELTNTIASARQSITMALKVIDQAGERMDEIVTAITEMHGLTPAEVTK